MQQDRNKKVSTKHELKEYEYNDIEIDEKEQYKIDKLSLDDIKKEWRKHVFESKTENIYEMKSQNDMKLIHDNNVNNIAACNLIHDIPNPSKRTKHLNIYYYPIIDGGMNTRRGRATCKSFRILLNSRYNSTIITIRLITKLKNKNNPVIQWHKQVGNITTNLKVNLVRHTL